MISLSYSRISLADIAQKLQLDSPEDAEFIVAKVPAQGIPSLWDPRVPTAPHPAPFPLTPPCSTAGFGLRLLQGDLGDTQGAPCPLCVSPWGHPVPCPVPGLAGHPGRRDRGQHQPREGLRAVQGDDRHLLHAGAPAGLPPAHLLLPRHPQHVREGEHSLSPAP